MTVLALLEVMDKEPSVTGMWLGALAVGGLGFWFARRWIWPGLLFLAWQALGLWAIQGELADRSVGPAILAEAGRSYPVHAYLSAALGMAAVVIGIAWGIMLQWRRGAGRDVHPAPAGAR